MTPALRQRRLQRAVLFGALVAMPACAAIAGIEQLDVVDAGTDAGHDAKPAVDQHVEPADTGPAPPSCATMNTDFTLPQTVEQAGDGSQMAWSNLNTIKLDTDSQGATTANNDGNTTSRILTASNFQFAIPDGATVLGITVQIQRKSQAPDPGTATNAMSDKGVVLFPHSASFDNLAVPGFYPLDSAVQTYGGTDKTWGLDLNPMVVNQVAFGVELQVSREGLKLANAWVDWIKMQITYSICQ